MKYDFHTWRKVQVWKKDSYTIEADTEQEAIERAKKLFQADELYPGYDEDNCEWYDSRYSEDEEALDYWDCNGPTYELWFDDGGVQGHLQDVIDDNTPIEVRRQKKLDELMGKENPTTN